jgi:hypothetical protein
MLLRMPAEPGGDLLQGADAIEVKGAGRAEGGPDKVGVGVVKAGQDEPAGEVDHAGGGRDEGVDLGVGADRDDLVAADGERGAAGRIGKRRF